MEPSIRPLTICWEKMTTPSISRRRSILAVDQHQLPDRARMRHFAAEWREAVKSPCALQSGAALNVDTSANDHKHIFRAAAIIPASARDDSFRRLERRQRF